MVQCDARGHRIALWKRIGKGTLHIVHALTKPRASLTRHLQHRWIGVPDLHNYLWKSLRDRRRQRARAAAEIEHPPPLAALGQCERQQVELHRPHRRIGRHEPPDEFVVLCYAEIEVA